MRTSATMIACGLAALMSTGCLVDDEESISSIEEGIYRGWRRLDQNGVGSNWGNGPGEGNIESATGLDLSLHVNYDSESQLGYASAWAFNYGQIPVWVDTVMWTVCTDGQVFWSGHSQVLFPVVPWQSPAEAGATMNLHANCPAGTGISAASFYVQADN